MQYYLSLLEWSAGLPSLTMLLAVLLVPCLCCCSNITDKKQVKEKGVNLADSNRDSPRQQESEVAGHIQLTGKKQKLTNICAHLTQKNIWSFIKSSHLGLGAPGPWEDIARHKVRAQWTISYMGFQRDFELQVPEESPSQHELQTMDLLRVLQTTTETSAHVYTHITNATFQNQPLTFKIMFSISISRNLQVFLL